MSGSFRGVNARIDPTRDGITLARDALDAAFGQGQGAKIVGCLNGYQYPIALIQKGTLQKLLDSLEALATDNNQLLDLVNTLRGEIDGKPNASLADLVLEFCKSRQSNGAYPRDTAYEAVQKFRELKTSAVELGGSFQIFVDLGVYITYDEATEAWSLSEAELR